MTSRTFILGDIHGQAKPVKYLVKAEKTNRDDVVILLGDTGANYFMDNDAGNRDRRFKRDLSKLPVRYLSLHGNHEEYPANIPDYHLIEAYGDQIYVEDEFPDIGFLLDGHIYQINGHSFLCLGGAYSLDKEIRFMNGWSWFESEQMSDEQKQIAMENLDKHNWKVEYVLSHTSPTELEPIWMYMVGIDQTKIDRRTELWLQDVYNKIEFRHWFYGHFHGDYRIAEKVSMLFHDYVEIMPDGSVNGLDKLNPRPTV